MYRIPLEKQNKKTIQRFQHLTPILSKETNICKGSYVKVGPPFANKKIIAYRIGGGFFIDNKGVLGRMNTISDVISFLDTINTESELEFSLRIQGHNFCKRYRNTKQGYEVECNESIEFFTKKLPCGIYKHKLFITDKGEIYKQSKYKLIKKTECPVI